MTEQANSGKKPNIVGVDFSGSKDHNTTAVTTAVLRDNLLEITSCCPLGSKLTNAHGKLKKLLKCLPNDAVVAMDFPFSIPEDAAAEFPEKFAAGLSTMGDLWRKAEEISDLDEFKKLSFIKDHATTMRQGDKELKKPDPKPPLKPTGNPTMLPMTFYGMKLLHHFRKLGFRVPPLDDCHRTGPVLLETMPGVALIKFNPEFKGYKGKSCGVGKKRNEVLTGLKSVPGLSMKIHQDFRCQCLADDDCLDSLVAAIVAALWKQDKTPDKSKFRTPSEKQKSVAQLEGWLYVPKPLPESKEASVAEAPFHREPEWC